MGDVTDTHQAILAGSMIGAGIGFLLIWIDVKLGRRK